MDSVTPAPVTLWQKQILAEDNFTHQNFTPEVLTAYVRRFDPNEGLPFTFADASTPEKQSAGTVTGLTYRLGEGVWANFQLTDDAAHHVQSYPRFGTTAIVTGDTITSVQGTNTPQIPGMDGWERIDPLSTEEESESALQYEEVSLNLSEPQLNQQNRGSKVGSRRDELIAELKRYDIDITTSRNPATDDLLVHLVEKCRAGLVNQARSEYRTGTAQHRVRLRSAGHEAPQAQSRTADLSYPDPQQEGKTMSNNLDPNLQFRLEQFVERFGGVSMTGQSQETVIELAQQLAPGREQEYTQAITGQDIIGRGLAEQGEMRAWMDNNL